ncbi:MAG: extracellular solute-binding protein [Treponema sp.]|nr:extracellular solute-binding protein [Treponema sp.]
MKRFCVLAVLLTLGFSLVFAGGRQASGGSSAKAAVPAPGPLGKYDPPLTVYWAKSTSSSDRYDEGYSIDYNEWTIEYLEQVGVDIKYSWTVDGSQYDQKMAASIATGDLPDMFQVNQEQFDMLLRSGLIWDLTDAYNQYGSELMKTALQSDPSQTAMAQVNGRLMGFPQLGHTLDSKVIWVRQDWLKKLNLPNPTTLENVRRIAEAFATKDPDGNGQNDTYGALMGPGGIWSGLGAAGFLSAYHAYHEGWLKDSSGSLVYAGIQPQVKTALAALNEWYAKGLIPRDWVNMSYDEGVSAIVSGKAGLMWGPFYLPTHIVQFVAMQPGGELAAYPWPSADSVPAKVMTNNAVRNYYVVNKKFPNPEALIKLLNYMFEFNYGSGGNRAARPYLQVSVSQGIENWLHAVTPYATLPNKNHAFHLQYKEVMKTGDTSILNVEALDTWKHVKAWYDGDNSDPWHWAFAVIFGTHATASHSAIEEYTKNDLILMNAFSGLPTAAMKTYQSSLDSLRDEIFTRIIIGELPLSAFDTFVADWKRQGGDDITREVNAWYKERK